MFRSIPNFAGAAALSLLLVLSACTGDAGTDIAGPSFNHNGCEGSGEEHESEGGFCEELINTPPVVWAGDDFTAAPQSWVDLAGTATDPDGHQIIDIIWLQIEDGSPVVELLIDPADPLKASFLAPYVVVGSPVDLTFSLTAIDLFAGSTTAFVTVRIVNNEEDCVATGECAECTDNNGDGLCDGGNDPIPVPTQIQALIEQVTAAGFDKNTAKSLLSLLQNASANYEKGDTAGAIDKLTSFVNQLSALNGRKGVNTSALIAAANAIIAQLTTP